MNSQTIVYCVVALILGMLMANMLKSVCGCNKVVEGGMGCEALRGKDRSDCRDRLQDRVQNFAGAHGSWTEPVN